MPAQTLAQKLLAAAAGRDAVRVGEILTCKVDLAMFHDSSGPRRLKPMLEELGTGLWDRSKVVLVMDHYVPEADDESRRIVRIARDWAREQALPHVYDSMGICHVVVPEHGQVDLAGEDFADAHSGAAGGCGQQFLGQGLGRHGTPIQALARTGMAAGSQVGWPGMSWACMFMRYS